MEAAEIIEVALKCSVKAVLAESVVIRASA